ncbi:potassium channel family protein [Bacillus mycoides]|nr:potassium channel family protein [Bacillus mycoides]KXY43900.1 transporter [Bacillus cereus]QEL83502.1 two pore domain potassium channel family protein [Bacillus mycoides]QWG62130.1 two pore domain potassium channel family protein [Bacillus mycoides]QWG88293.1 two pore domain potassium channel family protein [Bacillus mycoides]QWG99330.1 two pore domain potassium channel family protein [Bacillus mycoides]
MLSFILTLKRMLKACLRAWKDKEFQVLFVLTFLTLTSGTIFYSTVEGLRPLDALYFSVVTLTTVGDGNFSPQTDFGKVFTILYIFIGIGLVFGFIHKLAVNVQLPSILSNRKKE